MFHNKLLNSLNNEQYKAVTIKSGHTLVLAGAGSGKTKVLTTRIFWLIDTLQAIQSDMFIVTFTNKAAKELVMRLSKSLYISTKDTWIGTFHGLCHKMLRINYAFADLPSSFQILDVSDQLSVIKKIYKDSNIDDKICNPKDAQRFINLQKENGIRCKDLIFINKNSYKYLCEIYSIYEQKCKNEGLVDFSELLLKSYELLKNNQNIREFYNQKFKHILIDEFQDTNKLQYSFIKLLSGKKSSIFAVGDDDQSIYAFRGANVGNMTDFENNFAKKQVIRLEQNYRSLGYILNAANSLIEHNEDRLGKKLWTDQGDGEKIHVIENKNDTLEAQYISNEILHLVKNGTDMSNIAILYRSNAQSRIFEHALFLANIPYKVYGGLRFFERQEIKHILAYLKLIANKNDNISWLRVVNFPPRGIGSKTLEIQASIVEEKNISFYESINYIDNKYKNAIKKFSNIIDYLFEYSKKVNLVTLIEKVLEYSGLNDYYNNTRDGNNRLENISELITAAKTFSIEENCENLPAGINYHNDNYNEINQTPLLLFLSYASLEAGSSDNDNQKLVQMMTVHAAKGLEFDTVFITGLEEGLFPHENSINEKNGIAEERRLMYVAITRARKKLYITYSKNRMLNGQIRHFLKSRFLSEIKNINLHFHNFNHQFNENCSNTKKIAPTFNNTRNLYNIGQQVKHFKFGKGIILNIIGNGKNTKIIIKFDNFGIKELLLEFAKLE
ncbi:DNA helicase II [Candidatus Kinetoplastibacterium sorsogonicusi]|uniref:DNA 3'-5' helicase n=1 Tax=Candidatus Kinetoplastidibacterium kentomonadis TaxID=1576550 RepID=A0A3S7J9J8_9PROT|nr:UvrD-helicase domain-containing protein [Candidatus Kinetoplastibacterium sorsogonicusi]AWD32348.1 DNA helicase II [Candidatus Kinetoplastibacterium sorsogonicusi]